MLFTGASGFIGNNIKPILSLSYDIKTLGMASTDDYFLNLGNEVPDLKEKFDIILHAAGKAHTVPKTKEENKVFFDINFQGTKNLCLALEKTGVPSSFIFLSTVAVYGLEFGDYINEDYPLNGDTPYALSKIKAEDYLIDWCRVNGVLLSIIRPSLIAGPNPPGNLGKMINGIKTGLYLSISGGKARKSVLMVQDIANLIPLLAKKGGIYNVCDTEQPTFRDLEILISKQLGKPNPISIPIWIAKYLAKIGDFVGSKSPICTSKFDKITKSLTFSNEKIRLALDWEPINVLHNFKIK